MAELNTYCKSFLPYLNASAYLYTGTIGYLVCLAISYLIHVKTSTYGRDPRYLQDI